MSKIRTRDPASAMLTTLLPVLANPLYRRYMAGNSASLLGLWVHRVAIGWLTWEITHSGFWLGAIAFADLAPAILIGPFAGVWADRVDRVRLVIATQSASALLGLMLFALVVTDQVEIYSLLTIAIGLGVAASIAQPARLALIPLLVKAGDMSAAVALGSVAFNTARFVGPMLAGSMIAWADVSYAFLFNAITYAVMVFALYGIPSGLHATATRGDSRILQDVADGFRYALGHRTIRVILLIITCVAILAKPVAELLPGFADAVFGRGAFGLALLTQAMGIGALTGGILLARIDATRLLAPITAIGFVLTAVLVCVFGVTDNFYLGLGVLFLASMAMSCTGICTQTLTQHAVREDMRGRVLSIWGLIFRGAPAIGVLLMGAASEYSSLGFVVLVAGLICLLVSLAGLRWRATLSLASATNHRGVGQDASVGGT